MNERDDVGASSIIPSHPIHIKYGTFSNLIHLHVSISTFLGLNL